MATATETKPTLQTFDLSELAQFTREGTYASDASSDFHLFYVGRDDVHGILSYLWSRVTVSAYMNMFGYDDDELNELVMAAAEEPDTTTVYTLDQSQAHGVHEKQILASDAANCARFTAELVAEHMVAVAQGGTLSSSSSGSQANARTHSARTRIGESL